MQAGRQPADNVIGRFLMDLTMKVPQIEPQEFEEMLNSNMKVSFTGLLIGVLFDETFLAPLDKVQEELLYYPQRGRWCRR